MIVKRGDVYYANLSPVVGSEQGGLRPVLVIQNDVGNKYSPTIIVAAITSQISKGKLPTHVDLNTKECQLERNSVVLLEQLRTIDKRRLKEKITQLQDDAMRRVDEAMQISLGLMQF
jgi:mRNA interferase MazF